MRSFRELLQQVEECHDAEVARLRDYCAELEQHMDANPSTRRRRGQEAQGTSLLGSMVRCPCWTPVPIPLPPPSLRMDRGNAQGTSPPFREEPKEAVHAETSAPPQAELLEPVPFQCTFGEEVQQLGFRINWSGERPSIESIQEGAAYQSGIREMDTILAINGTDTQHQTRDDLLPLLRERPLQLSMTRSSNTQDDNIPSPASSSRDVADVTIAVPQAVRGKYQFDQGNRTASFGMMADSYELQEMVKEFSTGGSRRESVTGAKIGLKKYVEEEDVKETMVSKTVRLFTGPDISKVPDADDGLLSKARRLATDFAGWWDSLKEPDRDSATHRALESRWFRVTSAMVIVINAIVVTWLTDWSLQHSGRNMPPGFEVVDLAFLLFYAAEIGMKFYVHRGYFFANENAAWNIFDLILVIFSSFDVAANWPSSSDDEAPPNNLGYMRVFRMFKFAKILRTIRIIAFVRELSMMLESFRQCVIAMFWGLVLLLFLLYVFALVFAQGVASVSAHEGGVLREDVMSTFGSVGDSMLSLYMAVTGGNDWSVYYEATIAMGSFYPVVFLSYTFFFIFALFNILTGVFVERAVAAALPDREELIAQERKKILKQVEDLRALFKALDSDRSGKISKAEFLADMEDDRIVSYMHTLGLDMHDAEHFFDLLASDRNQQEVDIDTFIEHCMSMKGTATAMDLHKQLVQVNKVLDKLTAWELSNWPALFATLQEQGEPRR
ncbi:Scn11a [Symbiodinium sp. CCMP2592]|nr:Scn11a [Symbiodinium sp. CCMP2592]